MAVLSELALGVAHTLNNALTSIGGEASFLQSETKDPEVEQACVLILEQVERCARLTHALLRRRSPPPAAARECELGRVLRDVQAQLRDCLPRRLELSVEACEEQVLLAVSADEAETIVLLLVQHAALRLAGAGTLELQMSEPAAGLPAALELVTAAATQPGAAAAALHERLLRELVATCGGSAVFLASDGEERVRVSLPRLIEECAAPGPSSAPE